MLTTLRTLAGCLALVAVAAFAQEPEAEREVPTELSPAPVWCNELMEYLAQGSGRWRTMDPVESEFGLDGYEIHWAFGLGSTHLRGELLPVKAGRDFRPLWEFLMVWDPVDAVVRLSQHGSDGTTGSGVLTHLEGPERWRAELHLLGPDGAVTSFADEKTIENEDRHSTRSFLFQDEAWRPNARYRWKRQD